MIDNLRTWDVQGVNPTTHPNGTLYNKNVSIQVIAQTLEEAVEAVRRDYPEIKLVKVMADRWIEAVILAPSAHGYDGDLDA